MSRTVTVAGVNIDVDTIDREAPVLDALGLDARWLAIWRRLDTLRWRHARDHLHQALVGLKEHQEATAP